WYLESRSLNYGEGRTMEIATMGKVLVTAKIENLNDMFEVEQGRLKPNEVRCIDVNNALVDTGATFLSLPRGLVQQLGLRLFRTRRARTSSGELHDFDMYGVVRLTIQGRECTTEVAELSDNCPTLIGQIPLEMLDWVVDPIGQRLIG